MSSVLRKNFSSHCGSYLMLLRESCFIWTIYIHGSIKTRNNCTSCIDVQILMKLAKEVQIESKVRSVCNSDNYKYEGFQKERHLQLNKL